MPAALPPLVPPDVDLRKIEQALLGALMLHHHRCLWVSRFLHSEHFAIPAHRRIFEIISTIVRANAVANPVTVLQAASNHGTLDEIGGVTYILKVASDAAKYEEIYGLARQLFKAAKGDKTSNWRAWYNAYLNSDDWRAKRRLVMDRCGGLCEGCRNAPVDEIHHLTYEHVGDEFLYELVGLCVNCHRRVHS